MNYCKYTYRVKPNCLKKFAYNQNLRRKTLHSFDMFYML